MVELQSDLEEGLLGADSLLPRTTKRFHPHHTVFVEEEKEEIEEGEEEESVDGSDFGLGGSHDEISEVGQSEGSETLNGSSSMEFHVVSSDQIVEDAKSSLDYPEIRIDETWNADHDMTVSGYSNGTTKPDEAAVLEEGEQDSPDLDVERVLKEQETHDFFCPNCNSCITKRVILRRRKRKIQDISPAEEIVVPETVPDSSPRQPEVEEETIEDTYPGAFRCLSCFSIFVPIGRGFKLLFGGRSLKETDQDTPQLITSDPPAASVTGNVPEAETVGEQHPGLVTAQEQSPQLTTLDPPASVTDIVPEAGTVGEQHPDSVTAQEQSPQLTTSDPPASVTDIVHGAVDKQNPGLVTVQEQSPPHSTPTSLTPGKQDIITAVDVDSMALPVQQTLHPEVEGDGGNKPQAQKGDSMALPMEQTKPLEVEVDGGNKLCDSNSCSGTGISEDNKVAAEEMQIVIDRPEAQLAVPSTLNPKKDAAEIEPVDPENPVVVTVVQGPDQTVISVTVPTESSPETDLQRTPRVDSSTIPSTAPVVNTGTDDGDPQIEILKCIIYGGLLESIASLSVVTSAAGASARTLNIVALGAANMFGGLFILAHNLRELKHETSDERYEEALGHRGHFTLHSAVAVLSYIVCGLLPPVMYGFTFRESDNRDYKLIAVAVASLICIIMLAIGKSSIRTPPKAYMKTIMYYVGLWTMVCGVSYVAGELLELLLQKLELFESSSSFGVTVGEFRPVKMPWASS